MLDVKKLVEAGLKQEEAEYLARHEPCMETVTVLPDGIVQCINQVPDNRCQDCHHLLVFHEWNDCRQAYSCNVCRCESWAPYCNEHVPKFTEMGQGI